MCELDKASVELQKSIIQVKINEKSFRITLEMLISLKLAFFLNIEETEKTRTYVVRCNSAPVDPDDIVKVLPADRFLLCLD